MKQGSALAAHGWGATFWSTRGDGGLPVLVLQKLGQIESGEQGELCIVGYVAAAGDVGVNPVAADDEA